MKICVIIPREDASQQAGVRIRYNRIRDDLAKRGDSIRVETFEAFTGSAPVEDDVYIFSKCYDVRAPLLEQMLKHAGKTIGIDLFDDYFSQSHDSRLDRFRQSLDEMTGIIDFVLCSTPRIAEVARGLAHGLPVHVMNDPAPDMDANDLSILLRDKLDQLLETRKLKVCWFGMGDNPHFPVGLADLTAFAHKLAALERSGFEVSLAIRTNARALTTDALARLRRLPVPYSLDEWSVESETLLLRDSIACFIPTNGQNFSTAKSLNRALTALTHGAQVLSSGYPLYTPLSPFIYRDPADLLADIERRTLALRAETLGELGSLFDSVGNIGQEASAFLRFLKGLPVANPPGIARPARFAVVHGTRSGEALHAFASATGAITVASPYCADGWNFDVVCRFAANAARIEVFISEQAMAELPAEVAARCALPETFGARRFRSVRWPDEMLAVVSATTGKDMTALELMTGYKPVMRTVEAVIGRLFPGVTCLFSERSVFPYTVRGFPELESEH
jgi:hypothetical protein